MPAAPALLGFKHRPGLIAYSRAMQTYGNEPYSTDGSGRRVTFNSALALNDTFRGPIAKTLMLVPAVCGLSFLEVADGPGVPLRIGLGTVDGAKGFTAYADWEADSNNIIIRTTIRFDPDDFISDWPDWFRTILLHELLHCLGLAHYNDEPSMMNIPLMGGTTLTDYDIRALQYLYSASRAHEIWGTELGAFAMTGTGNDYISGSGGHDSFICGAGHDIASGGEGDDTIIGGAGNDFAVGDSGNDILDGGPGFDQFNAGPGNDSLSGGPDQDQLAGDDGDDILDGGAAADFVHGGLGSDSFILREGEVNGESIADFDPVNDWLIILGLYQKLEANGNGTWTITWGSGFTETFIAGDIPPDRVKRNM